MIWNENADKAFTSSLALILEMELEQFEKVFQELEPNQIEPYVFNRMIELNRSPQEVVAVFREMLEALSEIGSDDIFI